jgi:hypothetical protein
MNHVGLSGLDPFIEDVYPDLTVGAIALRRFAPDYFDIRFESISQILLVVFEFVLDQEFEKFVLETSLGMVLRLIANVSDDSPFL